MADDNDDTGKTQDEIDAAKKKTEEPEGEQGKKDEPTKDGD